MSQIVIDTAQVESTGGQFHSKSGELSALQQQAKTTMDGLMANFKGMRANKIYQDWQAMQPQIVKAVETLQIAGDLLKQAAAEFHAVDSAG